MYRFTIRDVLWLILVGAVCAGWWVEHRSIEQRERDLEDKRAKMESLEAFMERIRLGLHEGKYKTHLPPNIGY